MTTPAFVPMPLNGFRRGLATGEPQYGLWVSLADPVAAEIAAWSGYDWVLIDGEHAANDARTVLAQLQAVQATATSPIVRPPSGDPVRIKQFLDVGAQSLLVPMIDDAEQAAAVVAATRYPPRGIRGVASTRASRWGRAEGYWERADEELCVVVQVESQTGLANIEQIAAVEGVDAVFVGPADLGASMGYLGRPTHPDVRAVVAGAIARIVATGTPAGVLATTREAAVEYVHAGATMVGLGMDTALLVRGALDLRRSMDAPEGGDAR